MIKCVGPLSICNSLFPVILHLPVRRDRTESGNAGDMEERYLTGIVHNGYAAGRILLIGGKGMVHEYLFFFRYVDDVIGIRLGVKGQRHRKIAGRVEGDVLPEIQEHPEGGNGGRIGNTVL